ncbi:hypothetical protein STEG23_036551, partial [Scotinomys teguina]
MKFVGKRKELENTILSEVTQTQKDKHGCLCIWGIDVQNYNDLLVDFSFDETSIIFIKLVVRSFSCASAALECSGLAMVGQQSS